MEKLTGESKDILFENIETWKKLFPDTFVEGRLDVDVLKEILGEYVDNRDERYSFTWNGKSKARMIAQTPSTGTLRPCKEESVDWDSTQNIFIEGDNLEVLKLLQKSYHKKVKMIYIDPPYNTGKDFVYKDNFKDNIKNYKEITGQVDGEGRNLSNNPETSGRYHTDWLNMMYPRLKLARNLLKDDGVIFMSIDDNEVSNLRKMCDEIFGEENALVPFIWSLPRGINAGHISRSHETILIYSRDKDTLGLFKKLGEQDVSIDRCNKKIDRRHPASEILFPPGIKYEGEDQVITGSIEGSERIEIIGELEFKDGRLQKEVTLKAGWTMKNMILDWLEGKKVFDTKGQEIVEFFFKKNGKLYSKKISKYDSPKSILTDVPDTQGARIEIERLLGSQDIFSYPKPSALIRRFIELSTNDGDIIADFFAGSGSSAQATLESDAKRIFLLVQIPEKLNPDDIDQGAAIEFCKSISRPENIAEISKERIRRSAAKIKEENPDYDGDLGFKVFKLDSTNIKPWEVDFDLTERTLEDFISNIKTDRREEDVLFEILLKYGLDLTLPITEHAIAGQKVFDIGMGALIICLADAISLEVVEGITKLKDELNPEIMRVVFKDSGFKDDVVKTNAVQILKQANILDVRSL